MSIVNIFSIQIKIDIDSFDIISLVYIYIYNVSQIYLTKRSRKVDESSWSNLLSLLPSFAKDLFWKMNGGIVLSSRSLSIIPSVPSVRGRGTRTSLSLSLRSPFILHGSSCTEITGRRNEWRNYAATFGCVRCKKRGETWQRLDPLERRRRDANTLPFFCLLLRIFLSLSLSLWRPA